MPFFEGWFVARISPKKEETITQQKRKIKTLQIAVFETRSSAQRDSISRRTFSSITPASCQSRAASRTTARRSARESSGRMARLDDSMESQKKEQDRRSRHGDDGQNRDVVLQGMKDDPQHADVAGEHTFGQVELATVSKS